MCVTLQFSDPGRMPDPVLPRVSDQPSKHPNGVGRAADSRQLCQNERPAAEIAGYRRRPTAPSGRSSSRPGASSASPRGCGRTRRRTRARRTAPGSLSPGSTIGLKQITRDDAVSPSTRTEKLPSMCAYTGKVGNTSDSHFFTSGYAAVDAAERAVIDVGVGREHLVQVVESALVNGGGIVHEQLLDLQAVRDFGQAQHASIEHPHWCRRRSASPWI